MYLLIPGRHHLVTQFQFEYLRSLCSKSTHKDVNGKEFIIEQPVEAIIFAITSANHSNTRRNPLPFYLRAIAIEAMSRELDVPVYIFGVNDVGNIPNFASYTLKCIQHESEGLFNLTPDNTSVICSTPVLELYEQLGFPILPAELINRKTWTHNSSMPWDIVEKIAATSDFSNDKDIKKLMHRSSFSVWIKYHLDKKVQMLFRDEMIGNDGDLTETRDYSIYVRQMDDIAELKFKDTIGYVQPGRIGDIGCAVGSWIRLACKESRLRESDFYGIEVSRHLYEICRQRKENKEFDNQFVFFSQKNAVTGLAFDRNSMNTIHTSSLTHEIESYGTRKDLLQFIQNRYEELAPGGVWINRDVVAPFEKEKDILMWLNKDDGTNDQPLIEFENNIQLSKHLQALSTYSRFLRFAKDFRNEEGYRLPYTIVEKEHIPYIQLSLANAAEFLTRKDYCDNWKSEMHETFCFWDLDEWRHELEKVGFRIHPSSTAYTNKWIADNRWKGKVDLYDTDLEKLEYPVTTMLLIGSK
jgi:SAM-dependent methyltransferase